MPASAQPIACPKCKAVLGTEFFNRTDWQPCPSCASELRVEIFPALFREEKAAPAELVMAEGEAGCFYHPEKKAAVVCDACGRFLCALCDVDFNGQHLCTSCLEAGREKGKIARLQNTRTRHDRIAVALAVLPILVFYFTLITAPIALYYAIRHWKSPGSIVPTRQHLNLIIAILFASLQICGWILFFTWLAVKK